MSLPAGLTLRPATSSDAEAIHALGLACDLEDHGSSDFDVTDLTSEWDDPRFDFDRDSWMVFDGELLVGFSHLYPEQESDTYEGYYFVRPGQRGNGIEEFLIDAFEKRGMERAQETPLTLHTFAPSTDELGHKLIEARDFKLVRKFWRMDIDLRTEIVGFPAPQGVIVRTVDMASDAKAVHELIDRAFAGHWGAAPEPHEDWVRHWTESRPFDETLCLVAFEDDRLVGTSMNYVRVGEGYIGDLAVDATYRGRGLGAHLLSRSFEIFKERGFDHAMLNVDAENETGATRLYERVGMEVTRQYDVYEKNLPQ